MWHDFGINLWNRRGYNIDMTIKNGDLMGFIQQTMVIQPTKMELLVGITKKIIQLDGVRKTQVLSKQLSLM
jgi:aromatic ring hydroxylase